MNNPSEKSPFRCISPATSKLIYKAADFLPANQSLMAGLATMQLITKFNALIAFCVLYSLGDVDSADSTFRNGVF